MKRERWKQIRDTNYHVSHFGRIKNKNGKILKPYRRGGYLRIDLYIDKKRHKKMVHRLVSEAFDGYFAEDKIVHHNDGNKTHNHIGNLFCFDRGSHTAYHNKIKRTKRYTNAEMVEVLKKRYSGYGLLTIDPAKPVKRGSGYWRYYYVPQERKYMRIDRIEDKLTNLSKGNYNANSTTHPNHKKYASQKRIR